LASGILPIVSLDDTKNLVDGEPWRGEVLFRSGFKDSAYRLQKENSRTEQRVWKKKTLDGLPLIYYDTLRNSDQQESTTVQALGSETAGAGESGSYQTSGKMMLSGVYRQTHVYR